MSTKNNAKMFDKYLYEQAGIDASGNPTRFNNNNLKAEFRKIYRILDEQDAINRYTWYNLPDINSQLLERMIYYKGSICMFYEANTNKFYYMPFALDGTIDFYGRYVTIHPIPWNGGTTEVEKNIYKAQEEVLSRMKLRVYYDVPTEELTEEEVLNSAVIIKDYTPQLSQQIIPRAFLQESVIDVMSEMMPMMRTALRNSTGVMGMRVNTTSEADNVKLANVSVDTAVLKGERWIPVLGNVDFQDLASGNVAKGEEYMMALQSLDNFRLSLYGLETGGLFQKKSHMLEAEQAMNAGIAKLPLSDGLIIRQQACDIANSLWGIGVSCEISESAIEMDTNGDMIADGSNEVSLMEDVESE